MVRASHKYFCTSIFFPVLNHLTWQKKQHVLKNTVMVIQFLYTRQNHVLLSFIVRLNLDKKWLSKASHRNFCTSIFFPFSHDKSCINIFVILIFMFMVRFFIFYYFLLHFGLCFFIINIFLLLFVFINVQYYKIYPLKKWFPFF
jgi:hypothetical protein